MLLIVKFIANFWDLPYKYNETPWGCQPREALNSKYTNISRAVSIVAIRTEFPTDENRDGSGNVDLLTVEPRDTADSLVVLLNAVAVKLET